jgi:hypothetical protein
MRYSIHIPPCSSYPADIGDSYRLLTCNWVDDPEKIGIAKDSVIKLYNDHDQLNIKKKSDSNEPIEVLYVQEASTNKDMQNLLQIISIFNQLNSIVLFIYCDEDVADILQNYINEHIKLIKRVLGIGINISLETDVIITYGPGAIHFIKQGIPVVIAGPYGFGGWVTPGTLPFLLKNAFLGRAGGAMGEKIPIEIFAHELLSIKECKELTSVLDANKKYVDRLPYQPLSEAQKIINEHTVFHKKLHDSKTRWQMIPAVASNIVFEACGETIAVKRKEINDTLCTVSKEDMPFFKSINGKTNCEVLHKDSDMNEEDFWETIYSLNDRKIILF